MLTLSKLAELSHALAGAHVLSVYIDGRCEDPARRREWRHDLQRRLEALREEVAGRSREERMELDHCMQHLGRVLVDIPGAIGAPGWVGFFTATGERYAEAQPFATPTLADWRDGGRLAPCLDILEWGRRVYVAMVDSSSAKLYRCEEGTIERVATLHAHTQGRKPLHMGSASPQQFHQGTHGRAASDATDRVLLAGRVRLYLALVEELERLTAPEVGVLFGGAPDAVYEALSLLPSTLRRRACTEPALDVHASEGEIRVAGEAAGMALRDARDAAFVASVIDRAGAGAQGTIGWKATRTALEDGAVREAFLTRTFLKERVDESESLLRHALAHHAALSVVGGAGGDHLDAEAEGVGALLRYSLAGAGLGMPMVERGLAV